MPKKEDPCQPKGFFKSRKESNHRKCRQFAKVQQGHVFHHLTHQHHNQKPLKAYMTFHK